MDPFYGRAILEWPLMLASAVIFGTTMFAVAIRDIRGCTTESVVAALLPLWCALALIAFVVWPLLVISMTAEMAGVSWWNAIPLTREVMAQTHSGRVCQCCVPGALLLLIAAFVPMGNSVRLAVFAILSALLMIFEALLSHAIDKGAVAVAIYFIHEAAAGAWLGALLGFWIVARRARPEHEWIARTAGAVSAIAAWSVGAIVLSGIYTAYQELGFSLDRLLFSSYGRTLIIKVVVFCAVLSVGAYNRERLLPEATESRSSKMLLRNVGLESIILGLVVLGLASLLANTPPAKGHMMMHPGVAMDAPAARRQG